MQVNKSLVKGSLVFIVSFGVFNILNFTFQLLMARMLSLTEYSVLAALFSIGYILAVFTDSIQTVITKYTEGEKDGKIKNIIKKSFNKSAKVSLGFFILYVLVSIPLSFVLDISIYLMIVNGLLVFGSFLLPVPRAVMQAKNKFMTLGGNMISEAAIKIVAGVILVVIGWGVYGAVIGTVIGFVGAFILAFTPGISPVPKVMKSKEKDSKIKGIYDYTRPTFFVILLITLFYSIDVIIAKIVFSPENAGAYAIASVLSKAIFWGAIPISRVMFPASSSERKKGKKNSQNILINSLLLLSGFILCALVVFFFFPSLIINIFAGRVIEDSARILFLLGVAMSFISFSNLILFYNLSINKTKGYPYLFFILIVEIVLLFLFSSSIVEYVISLIFSSILLLWASIYIMRE